MSFFQVFITTCILVSFINIAYTAPTAPIESTHLLEPDKKTEEKNNCLAATKPAIITVQPDNRKILTLQSPYQDKPDYQSCGDKSVYQHQKCCEYEHCNKETCLPVAGTFWLSSLAAMAAIYIPSSFFYKALLGLSTQVATPSVINCCSLYCDKPPVKMGTQCGICLLGTPGTVAAVNSQLVYLPLVAPPASTAACLCIAYTGAACFVCSEHICCKGNSNLENIAGGQ